MKRMAALMGALFLTLVLAAPAAAVKPAPYVVAVAACVANEGDNFRYWEGGRSWHVRDYEVTNEAFLLVGDDWVPDHELTVFADFNNGRASGTFEVRGSALGDFDGRWSCAMGNCTGTGKSVGDAHYDHLRIVMFTYPEGLPPLPDEACGGPYDPEAWEVDTWLLN